MAVCISRSVLDTLSPKLNAVHPSITNTVLAYSSSMFKSNLLTNTVNRVVVRYQKTLKLLFCTVDTCQHPFAPTAKPYFQLITPITATAKPCQQLLIPLYIKCKALSTTMNTPCINCKALSTTVITPLQWVKAISNEFQHVS